MKRLATPTGFAALLAAAVLMAACTTVGSSQDLARVRTQVAAAERAFAKAMADRSLEKFAEFVSEEAVFFSGPQPLRGKAEVIAGWAPYFVGPTAPFSWEPDEVEPLASGTLAHSSGPVRAADGTLIARFNSVWRLEAPGIWRVVFDKGSPLVTRRE